MDTILLGGAVRFAQGMLAAAPTVLIGIFVAALLRFYFGAEGTRKLFGGQSLISLPVSWLVGMLLPVCSIGVIPIVREMKRIGMRPGAIMAFALAAPLFNPLSLLYGLTLSRPIVIIGFAFASLIVVTVLGLIWDRYGQHSLGDGRIEEPKPIGFRRVVACGMFGFRELIGPTGGLYVVALLGLFVLGMILPHGALQSSVEQDDWLAPLKMAIVAVPIYATPMMTMSQLGMMFDHGNSPGAAFCLLLFGTGVNVGTLVWTMGNYGLRRTGLWFGTLFLIVVGLAYAVDKPLIPPGVEPAGHTHAFDVYTNPFHFGVPIDWTKCQEEVAKSMGIAEAIAFGLLVVGLVLGGLTVRFWGHKLDAWSMVETSLEKITGQGFDRIVSPQLVGVVCVLGLIALSIVGCYAYYPDASESLEEMRLARTEALVAVASGNYKAALHWIPILDEWSRRLEVGSAIRNWELRPYQHVQAHLLREKLELLEHEIEHAMEGKEENPQKVLRELSMKIHKNSIRLNTAFSSR